jgi:DNA polymerase I-like protein with 3'-5' exonuclease and polymerase domains
MTDPVVISLDIETYGACEETVEGDILPPQTVFNPHKSMSVDGVPKKDLILTVSITLPKGDPQWPKKLLSPKPQRTPKKIPREKKIEEPYTSSSSNVLTKTPISLMEKEPSSTHSDIWDPTSQEASDYLRQMSPDSTQVFRLHKPEHRMRLARWLSHSQVILGMNLQFDLQYLRVFPEFKFRLEHQLLIDLSILNYLHDETRPEKSLKSLGPILGTHTYNKEETLKGGRFLNPKSNQLLKYNAQDTHNTLLAISELSRRIHKDFPNTSKLSDWCLKFYSDTIWTCIRMSEAGIPMDRNVLIDLEKTLTSKILRSKELAQEEFGVLLEGPGSGKSKTGLLSLTCDVVDGIIQCETGSQIKTLMMQYSDSSGLLEFRSSLPFSSSSSISSIRDNQLLQVTPKKGELSFSEENRNLLVGKLPPTHPLQNVFSLAKEHSSSQKLLSSYCFPLLKHRRNKPTDKSSVLIPSKGIRDGIELAHPTWYPVPTLTKDSKGTEGGTLQGRITCKKPSAQTFPKQIKRSIQSRFRNGAILEFDLSQIELRVAALLSGDAALMGAYLEGIDLHKQRAEQIFGHRIKDHPDFNSFRQAGKMINFADLFRSGPSTMQSQLLAMTGELHPLPFFKEVASNRKHHRPGLWKWQNQVISSVRSNGYYALPFTGQSRYFLGGDKWDENEIVNFPIQTTAGNTLLRIQHRMHHDFLPSLNSRSQDAVMFLNIYDALYIDCKEDQIENLIESVSYAIRLEETEGYWSQLQELTGRRIPLEWGVEIQKR